MRGYVKVISEYGYDSAMLGLSLSHNAPVENMYKVAKSLAFKGGGHSKSLESMFVTLDMNLPRFLWQEVDVYRVGVTKQSESTIHTLLKKPLSQENFYMDIYEPTIDYLNKLIKDKAPLDVIKNELPEGFLQRRIVVLNYMSLQNIIRQRWNHKLTFLWRDLFCKTILASVKYPEFLYKES